MSNNYTGLGAGFRHMGNDVEIYNEMKCFKGYTLFAPSFQNKTAWLIDMRGNIVHYWEMKNPPGLNYKLLPNGNLMWMGRGPGAIKQLNAGASELIEVDWDGNEVWRYDDPMLNHDFEIQKNGNIILLRFELIPKEIQEKIKGGVPGTEIDGRMYGVQLREINRNKETLWEWNNWEHFDPEKDIDCPFCDREIWGYTNSIDVFPNGDPIISVRRMNKVIRISKDTGEIIWEWGPKQNIGHQHDVSVLSNSNITIFDNGLHRRIYDPKTDHKDTSNFIVSRALEVDTKTGNIVWEYIDPFHLIISNFCGSVQKLPNGNYMILDSASGTFYEVTKDKEVVWKYLSPFILSIKGGFRWEATRLIFQAHRYGEDFEGFKDKDLDPEKYEWIIHKKSKENIQEEEMIQSRLARAGY